MYHVFVRAFQIGSTERVSLSHDLQVLFQRSPCGQKNWTQFLKRCDDYNGFLEPSWKTKSQPTSYSSGKCINRLRKVFERCQQKLNFIPEELDIIGI